MAYYKNLKCYICTTRTSAGIFLSGKIMDKKIYGRHLRTEVFENFADAEKVFWERYSDQVSKEKFHLNQLYQVKDKKMYSVYSTPYLVGMSYTDNFYDNLNLLLPKDSVIPYTRHNLTYEEATNYVRSHFARWYNNPDYYVDFSIRLHEPIHLFEVQRAVVK